MNVFHGFDLPFLRVGVNIFDGFSMIDLVYLDCSTEPRSVFLTFCGKIGQIGGISDSCALGM